MILWSQQPQCVVKDAGHGIRFNIVKPGQASCIFFGIGSKTWRADGVQTLAELGEKLGILTGWNIMHADRNCAIAWQMHADVTQKVQLHCVAAFAICYCILRPGAEADRVLYSCLIHDTDSARTVASRKEQSRRVLSFNGSRACMHVASLLLQKLRSPFVLLMLTRSRLGRASSPYDDTRGVAQAYHFRCLPDNRRGGHELLREASISSQRIVEKGNEERHARPCAGAPTA